MKYYNLIISRESAWEVMNQLAELEALHLVDHDPQLPTINRPFANYIKRYSLSLTHYRCDDSLIRVAFLQQLMERVKKPVVRSTNPKKLLHYHHLQLRKRQNLALQLFLELSQATPTSKN